MTDAFHISVFLQFGTWNHPSRAPTGDTNTRAAQTMVFSNHDIAHSNIMGNVLIN